MVRHQTLIYTSTTLGGLLERLRWPIHVVLQAAVPILAHMQQFLKVTKLGTKAQRCFPSKSLLFGRLVPLLGLVGA